jgi:hypothetical protein
VIASAPNQGSSSTKPNANVGVISASVIAGVLAVLAGYLAFCTWLYRRQLKLYRNHVVMAQRTAFAGSPDIWNSSGEARTVVRGGANEKIAAPGTMSGPFSTEIGSANAGRASLGASSTTTGRGSPTRGWNSGESSSQSIQGSAINAGSSIPGRVFERFSEGGESAEHQPRPNVWGNTAHSSMEDLLGEQEPSFFSVVLNPRRTLRVVNLD